jgi:hypothetical protein
MPSTFSPYTLLKAVGKVLEPGLEKNDSSGEHGEGKTCYETCGGLYKFLLGFQRSICKKHSNEQQGLEKVFFSAKHK